MIWIWIYATIGITSLWVLIDAFMIDVKQGQIKGLFGMGYVGWFFASLFLWPISFPAYLIKRDELKRLNGKQILWFPFLRPMKNGDILFRAAVLLLLTAILLVQCLILKETHDARLPTMGDLRKAKGDARREIYLRRPMVVVRGSVDIDR